MRGSRLIHELDDYIELSLSILVLFKASNGVIESTYSMTGRAIVDPLYSSTRNDGSNEWFRHEKK